MPLITSVKILIAPAFYKRCCYAYTASICNEHGISQSQYYQWKDQFLANAAKAFDVEKVTTKQAHLECENQKLKGLVGELTLEKSEGWS